MQNQEIDDDRDSRIEREGTDFLSAYDRIEVARKRGRDHARHLLLYYGIQTIDPERRIVVTEASEQEIALHQEANAISAQNQQRYRARCEEEELAYLRSVEDAGGWDAFLEQRKAFHDELARERQVLWQAQVELYGE